MVTTNEQAIAVISSMNVRQVASSLALYFMLHKRGFSSFFAARSGLATGVADLLDERSFGSFL